MLFMAFENKNLNQSWLSIFMIIMISISIYFQHTLTNYTPTIDGEQINKTGGQPKCQNLQRSNSQKKQND